MKLSLILIVIALAAVTFFVMRKEGDHYAEFSQNAQKITGVVVTQKEVVIDPKNQRKEMQVEYRYLAGGLTHTAVEKVEYEDLWRRMMPGEKVDVYVSNEDPGKAYLARPLDRRLKVGAR